MPPNQILGSVVRKVTSAVANVKSVRTLSDTFVDVANNKNYPTALNALVVAIM